MFSKEPKPKNVHFHLHISLPTSDFPNYSYIRGSKETARITYTTQLTPVHLPAITIPKMHPKKSKASTRALAPGVCPVITGTPPFNCAEIEG